MAVATPTFSPDSAHSTLRIVSLLLPSAILVSYFIKCSAPEFSTTKHVVVYVGKINMQSAAEVFNLILEDELS